jgi:hypothetical protein
MGTQWTFTGGGGGGSSTGMNINNKYNTTDAGTLYAEQMQKAIEAQYQTMLNQAGLETSSLPTLQKLFTDKYTSMMDSTLGLQNKYLQPTLDLQGKFASGMTGIFNNTYNGIYGNMSGPANQSWGIAKGAYDALQPEIARQTSEVARTQSELGGQLNEQQINFGQQVARAAAASRGLQLSQQGSNLEVLNTYNLGIAREKARQDAYVQQQAALAAMYGVGNQAIGNINAAEQNRTNIANIAAQNATNVFNRSTLADLYSQLGYATNGMGSLAPSLLNPESTYPLDILKQQMQNANMANAQAALNNAGKSSGGGSSSTGKSKGNNFNNKYVNDDPSQGLASEQLSIFGKPVKQLYGAGGATAKDLPTGFVKASDFLNTTNQLGANAIRNAYGNSNSFYGDIPNFNYNIPNLTPTYSWETPAASSYNYTPSYNLGGGWADSMYGGSIDTSFDPGWSDWGSDW